MTSTERHAVGELLDGDHLGNDHLAHDFVASLQCARLAQSLALAAALERSQRALALGFIEGIVDGELDAFPALFADLHRAPGRLGTLLLAAGVVVWLGFLLGAPAALCHLGAARLHLLVRCARGRRAIGRRRFGLFGYRLSGGRRLSRRLLDRRLQPRQPLFFLQAELLETGKLYRLDARPLLFRYEGAAALVELIGGKRTGPRNVRQGRFELRRVGNLSFVGIPAGRGNRAFLLLLNDDGL
jgi:hypothetical protein